MHEFPVHRGRKLFGFQLGQVPTEELQQESANRRRFAQSFVSPTLLIPVPEYMRYVGAQTGGNIYIVKVILFGSTVRDEAHSGSDVDLCVTFPVNFDDWAVPERVIESDLREAIYNINPEFGADVVCFPDPGITDPSYFSRRDIWKSIMGHGQVLYQA